MQASKIGNKRRKAVLKQKARQAWNETKDVILCIILLNMLIGQLQQIEIPTRKLVFEAPALIQTAEASTIKVEEKILEKPKMSVKVTTYNAEEGQTDADPYTMASGKRVFEGAVASNCHPFGTKVEIEGIGTFEVQDRMNSRYTKECGTENERMDIFKWDRKDNFKNDNAKYSIK